jgi:uncharacterized membrane protein
MAGDADDDQVLGRAYMEAAVGGMMGATSGWVLLWIMLAVVLAVAGGTLAARALATRHGTEPLQSRGDDSPAVRKAKDALRLRYANGEISREEYLQGKVELEDLPGGTTRLVSGRAEPAQPQAVGDHEHGTERHRGPGDQRAEEAERGQRDGEDVVGEGPEQVPFDGGQRAAG